MKKTIHYRELSFCGPRNKYYMKFSLQRLGELKKNLSWKERNFEKMPSKDKIKRKIPSQDKMFHKNGSRAGCEKKN